MQSVVLIIIGVVAFGKGCAYFFVVPKFFEFFFDSLSVRDFGEISKSEVVLLFYPLGSFGRAIVFEPTVGVGDLSAKIGVYRVVHTGLRVIHFLAVSVVRGLIAGY